MLIDEENILYMSVADLHTKVSGAPPPNRIKFFRFYTEGPVGPLYGMIGNELKMGQVDLPPEVKETVDILKRKIQSVPVLVFPDFNKPFLLETDASNEGLGAVLSQKQSDGHYHPVTFGHCCKRRIITALS